ncbi:MAG TPA: cupin domain-containing protein [Flavilitoribacter sp.]|nr:cupin domain-containing protein [Flavilitoribacter sp.]
MDRPYLPFLNESTLGCGIYKLAVGAEDEQEPHQLDEVYYVLKGKGEFRAGEAATVFNPGDVLFVAARVEHQFYEISEDLELLVFFSTAKPD